MSNPEENKNNIDEQEQYWRTTFINILNSIKTANENPSDPQSIQTIEKCPQYLTFFSNVK